MLTCSPGREGAPPVFKTAFFTRTPDDPFYTEFEKPPAPRYCKRLVVSAGAPFAFLLVRENDNNSYTGLYRAHLQTGALDELPQPITTPDRHMWISELLGASSDGERVHVVTAWFPTTLPTERFRVPYAVMDMSVATGEVRLIADLESPYW
jgi:hypothetical protein